MRDALLSRNNVHICKWTESDKRGYAELAADPEVMRFISGGRVKSPREIEGEVARFNREIETRGWSRWAVRCGDDGTFTGYTGYDEKDYGIDFGQRHLRPYWRTAIPYFAAHMTLCYGFDELKFCKITSFTDLRNWNAIRLNRKYLGLDERAGEVCATPFGPHLKIEVDYDMFARQRERNDRMFERFAQRVA